MDTVSPELRSRNMAEARRLREPQGLRYPLHRRVGIVEPIGRPLFAYLVQHQVEGEPLGRQPPVQRPFGEVQHPTSL